MRVGAPKSAVPAKRSLAGNALPAKAASGKGKVSSQKAPLAAVSSSTKDPAPNVSFPVVVIGASAGGLEAYTDFFHALPRGMGMAFVLVQHLDPTHYSLLPEIIAKTTKMPVETVKAGVRLRPDRVYVIPHDSLMEIADGKFRLTPRSRKPGQHLAINFFMRSLAEDCGGRAIGIVLSGTGADGTLGLESIKAEGGITLVQDPATAKFDGMPRSAIDSGCADFVLEPGEIAQELRRIQRHPYAQAAVQGKDEVGKAVGEGAEAEPTRPDEFATIVDQLRRGSGVDFSQYRPNTIHRRALRRMVILKLESLGDYGKYLKEHPEECEKLYDDVLIPVTSFFRDFEAFEALKRDVYPAILKDKGNRGTIRMWAPGCSTGEETYSLAMTLLEFLGDRAASYQVQIFGTDLNEKGIQKARAGVYRESIAEEISAERMERFFVKVDEGYRVNKAVRDLCVFARQNLASDPPFSQMNVVACRNLLIYIQPVLQKKIIPILHYALKTTGFLVLGSSESVSNFPDLFSTVDKKHKIYAKKAIASRLHYDFSQMYYPAAGGFSNGDKPAAPARKATLHPPTQVESDVQAEADQLVLSSYAPAGVVVNSAMEVVQFRGRTTPYLEAGPGKPTLNVLKLAQHGLSVELRTLIGAAETRNAVVRKDGVSFEGEGGKRMLNLSVSPLGEKRVGEKGRREDRSFLILFEDVTSRWMPRPGSAQDVNAKVGWENKAETKRLQQELAGTRDALRAAMESEDSLKEEFQSANEEILSANEELQSSNEELETSKEELQSANEELNTLNAELRFKNSELHDLSNDISNLLNSTRIPVVMLDRHLKIRRMTPTADKLLKVVATDIGRQVADIRLNLNPADLDPRGLEAMIAKVLENLQPEERDVRDLGGCWHSLTILPYQTQENKIDGVVLALQDIDAIKVASEQLKRAAEFFRGVMDTVREPLLVLDADLKVNAANESFYSAFQLSAEQTVNKHLFELGTGEWDAPKLRLLLEDGLPKGQVVTDFEMEHSFEGMGRRHMVLNARKLLQPNKRQPMILLAIEDVTESRKAEEEARKLRDRLEQQFRIHHTTLTSIPDIAYTLDRAGCFLYANPRLLDLWGLTLDETVGKNFYEMLYPKELSERVARQVEEVFTTGRKVSDETAFTSVAGVTGQYEYILSPVFGATSAVDLVVGSARDVTERRLQESALVRSEKLAAAGRLAATLAHEINNPLQAVTNLMSILRNSPTVAAADQVFVTMADKELARVTHLTRQSLRFYREISVPREVNVAETLEEVVSLYAKQIEALGITVREKYLTNTPIESYPGEIRQVFTTLLVNSMEATPPGGTIAVRVRQAPCGPGEKLGGVQILVADSGIGIPAENKGRVFEAFFTTKGEQGIGLGLWVAQGLVSRLGGRLRMRSSVEPGKSGTSFSLCLPYQKPSGR